MGDRATRVPRHANGTASAGAPVPPPAPVPELVARPTTEGVTDEDRNRYGSLLDRAAERGLLPPADYELRLRDLAAATDIDELQRIVTELPVFAAPAPTRPVRQQRSAARTPSDAGPGGTESFRGNTRWLILVVLVVVLLASLAFLAVAAGHLVKHPSGTPAPVRAVSALRL